jgi:sugar lactone lactonase YvrE
MKQILLLAALAITLSALHAQPGALQEYLNKARDAYKGGDHLRFYEAILEAQKLHPYHQGILYQAGLAAALNNKPDEAVTWLTKAVQIKADYDLTHRDLASLSGRDDFAKLKALQADLQQPIIHSDTAFVVKDRTAHIESIAAGESRNVFYLGSIHKRKIIRVDEKGNSRDFTTAGQDGLTAVFGVKVDATRRILWACASPVPQMENFDTTSTSSVFRYDIKTGKLLARYSSGDKREYVFGDLALSPGGGVFTSDSKNNIIFTVNEGSGKLENYFTSAEFWSIQGITFSDDGRYLFIADYIKGVFRLDTKDKTLVLLGQDFPLSLKSIDGLTFYDNSLVAIQNLVYPMRVTRYFLNATRDRLVSHTIIDRAHPAFNEPTIGCLANNTFYYVANSLWSGYDAKNRLKPEHELQDVVILKAGLGQVKK